VLALAFAPSGPDAPASPKPVLKPNHYIGVGKCKDCHRSKSIGNQYGVWSETRHAQAFETLGGDKAKATAKERGIADPQKADECLKCHVTAFGEPKDALGRGFKPELGVQCESCHGPGERHFKARMAAAMEEEDEFAEPAPIPAGEIISRPSREACVKCHNTESPFYKPFCYGERLLKIRHLIPGRKRTPEQEKALHTCGCGDACELPEGCKTGACPLEKAAGS
jgi:hypothetical protein